LQEFPDFSKTKYYAKEFSRPRILMQFIPFF
jgi:hypothetical protein